MSLNPKLPSRLPVVTWIVTAASLLGLFPEGARAQADRPANPPAIRIITDEAGSKLQVDGRDFMIMGMNWGYIPIGHNYSFGLWNQPDDVIEEALAREMPLLRNMGINTIKQLSGVPPRWVRYIYERYGIYTVLNHQMARYGFLVDGTWIAEVDYADPRLREAVTDEIVAMVEEFRGTPGLLMWLLGNENNYGLSWTSFEIEALPEGERDTARARYLYSLFGEVTGAIKGIDSQTPVAIANGDLQYIDVIAEECQNLDVFGTNVYRGISVQAGRQGLDRHGPLFDVVKAKLGIPVLYTEFGSDAFNAKEMREDQMMQAHYLIGQWSEIYQQSYAKGGAGNSIGGIIFQWSDGWWKYGQDSRLDIHDTHASWPNSGYLEDYVDGSDNMNEEWFGICAKGPTDPRGLFEVYPRAAYYALRRAFTLDPYAPGTTLAAIRAHFGAIDPAVAEMEARGDRASLLVDEFDRARLTGLRLEIETFSTGGKRVSTPLTSGPGTAYPAFRGFDHLQSYYADFEARPAENVTGKLSLSVLGNVPTNPIDEIFYENRGRRRTIQTDGGTFELDGIERVKVYNAAVSWDDQRFLLDGFYRAGHFHWGFEGDFFGLYREAYYGENIDIYNGEAPVGLELSGKRSLEGLKLAFGQQLWWGANPALIVKYSRRLGAFEATGMFHEDISEQSSVTSSVAVPIPSTRKATLQVSTRRGQLGIDVGGIWSGSTKIDEPFQSIETRGEQVRVLQDRVRASDAFGAKAKVTAEAGRWHWYAKGAYMGVVADGGPDPMVTFTGWRLKDSGSGNQANVLTGVAVNTGDFQIGPNFLWQKPLVGPVPFDAPAPGRPRNVLDDPFAVRANRETVGGELLIAYDPTPATWMWAWDNDVREDAPLAASVGLVYRHHPTTQDASIGILADGRTTFAFPGAPPARDLWEAHARVVSGFGSRGRLAAHIFAGTGEPNGSDGRRIRRVGGDARVALGPLALETFAKFNDWGPYDYHRDFNNTFPVQLMGDVSHTLVAPRWFGVPQTRFGVRSTWRSLDRYSPRYCPERVPGPSGSLQCDPTAPGLDGSEWEIRTYLHLAL